MPTFARPDHAAPLRTRLRQALLVLCLLGLTTALGACASGPPGRGIGGMFESSWTFQRTEPHPALQSGVELSMWSRGQGSTRERSVVLRTDEGDVAVDSLIELAAYARPIDSAEAAIQYANLVHRVKPGDDGPAVDPLRPAPGRSGAGGSGVYTQSDTDFWGIPAEPVATPYGGGFVVSHVLLLSPVAHPHLPRHNTPWRVVERKEIVYPDGHVQPIDERTLTNGEDAARFATY